MTTAVATAHPNIAVVKYWGKRDRALNLPAVSSLSLTLAGYHTTTSVRWGTEADKLVWREHGQRIEPPPGAATKIWRFLDRVDPSRPPCAVDTHNTVPTAAGLASSSSGFAALALAAITARDGAPPADRTPVSALARQGSGSACRSLWGGWVVWRKGERADGRDSHGEPIAPAEHWDVAMVVAVVSGARKAVGSTEGMVRTAATSPLWQPWVAASDADVFEGMAAVRDRDLERLGTVMERSTLFMHATMQTATPPILYWQPATVACLHAVHGLRAAGVGAWATMDAGPNVKVLCAAADAERVAATLREQVAEVAVHHPGPDATVSVQP